MFSIESACVAGALIVSFFFIILQNIYDNKVTNTRLSHEEQLVRSLNNINSQLGRIATQTKKSTECNVAMYQLAAAALVSHQVEVEASSSQQEEEEEEEPLSRFNQSNNSSQEEEEATTI